MVSMQRVLLTKSTHSCHGIFSEIYNTSVQMANPYPAIAGSDVMLSCNITKVGYPREIYKFQWLRGIMLLQDNHKYQGTDSTLLTIKVRDVRLLVNRGLSSPLNFCNMFVIGFNFAST